MKKILILLAMMLIIHGTKAAESPQKSVNTNIKSVIIFKKGAQINRKASTTVNAGKTIIKFGKLSPYIDAQSIRVKTPAHVTILSVNHQFDYLNKQERSETATKLDAQIKDLDDQLKLEHTRLDIQAEQLKFLNLNSKIGSENGGVQVSQLQQAVDFYKQQITEIKLKEIEHKKAIAQFEEEKSNLEQQLKNLNEHHELPSGEILVTIETNMAQKADFDISYFVKNTGWYPSYDIRVASIDEPMALVYKANIYQNTNVDWDNVQLTITSAEPDRSNVAPELKPYLLGYNLLPPSYDTDINQVTGIITGENGDPLPGVNVLIKGTTVGTVTDLNGYYSITLPNGSQILNISYVGYQSQDFPVNSGVMNVQLRPDVTQLNEVVVTAYGTSSEDDLQGRVSGVTIQNNKKVKIRGVSGVPIDMTRIQNNTVVEFQIRNAYSVPSGDKSTTVEMVTYAVPAYFEYYAVPKVEKSAFLVARIVDWSQYNLLEGEANIIFEDTYIGKSILDARNLSDTLSISLGRDKGIVVERKQEKQFTDKKFLGSRKEESMAWNINIRNNKQQKINMVLLDQLPVSTNADIEVMIDKISDAERDEPSGKLKWQFALEPGKQKTIELAYTIKYPKYQQVYVE